MDHNGYLALVLHAHLPFVRHPEHEDFLEEGWLYEAITETYLPLLELMENWTRDGVEWKLTMSLTPTLCSMLSDELLQERYVRHIEQLTRLAEAEVERTSTTPKYHNSAQMYLRVFTECREAFINRYQRDLISGFRKFQESGNLEIITCSATHGYMPLMKEFPEAVKAQVSVGVDHYRKMFGRDPRGIWNAECGYFPGLDKTLAEQGLKFFFTDSHGLLFATTRPRWGVFAPMETPSGVVAFGRDQESSRAVWSAELGYPGDQRYREFYRDIGFDLEMNYLTQYVGHPGHRRATGIKYHRITGTKIELHDKEPYNEDEAREAANSHAAHFLFSRQQQVLHLNSLMEERPPIIVSPYDAELFGHWWYEGPQFLDFLVRKIHYDQDDIALTTPMEYLENFPENQVGTPSMSSWGFGGFSEVWLEGSNDWIYRHLEEAAERMIGLANDFPEAEGEILRALNQAAREVLLAQASDWAFIMKTGTVVDYATRRTKQHVANFHALHDAIRAGDVDTFFLERLESRDNLFPEIDYRVYRSR